MTESKPRAHKGHVQLAVIDLVHQHPGGIKVAAIAEKLGKSPRQIHGIVRKLGLRREGGLVFPNEVVSSASPRSAPRRARSRRKAAARAMTGSGTVKTENGAGSGLRAPDGHGQELIVRFTDRGLVVGGDVGYVRRQPDGSVFVGLRRPEDLVHGHQPMLETGVEYPVAPGAKRDHFR